MFSISYPIILEPQWISQTENEWADYPSKIYDFDDSIDRFASPHDHLLPLYNSWHWIPCEPRPNDFTYS